jgi:hypothetical protein
MNNLKFNQTKNIIALKESIDNIMKTTSMKPGVSEICNKYYKKINEGVSEDMLYDSFVYEMKSISGNIINTNLLLLNGKANDINLKIKKAFYKINESDTFLGEILEGPVVKYLVEKTNDTRNSLVELLSMYESSNGVNNLKELVIKDGYLIDVKGDKNCISLLETKQDKLYTIDEVKKIVKKSLKESKENDKKVVDAINESKLSNVRDVLRLDMSIDAIVRKESKNEKLRAFCESYSNAIRNGKSQYALYEAFISGLSQWNYLNAVDTEISALNDRIGKYKQEINLMKIVDAMKESTSYYIVPLIESSVAAYMKNKNGNTRVMLRQACDAFMFDPFVKDLMNIVDKDLSISNLNYMGEALEANATYTNKKNIYSPILYVKENETAFNVGGVYYSSKGSNISKLSKSDVNNLNESFKHACNCLNDYNVSINEATDDILIYSDTNNKKAVINESGIFINDEKIELKELKNPVYKIYCNDDKFYDTVCTIAESFDTIAPINFVKRVELINSDRSVDVFKLKNTISIALNESGFATFYRNINPIQCKNYINEHMGLNVTSIFEDVLPSQEKIEEEINDTKSSYESYLEELKEKRSILSKLKEEDGDVDEEETNKAIDLIDKEIDDITKDYKEYQKNVDDYTGKSTNKEKSKDSDIKSVSVDLEDEVTEPITDEFPPTDGTNTLSDDDLSNINFDDGILDDEPKDKTPVEYAGRFDDVLDVPSEDYGFEITKVSFNQNVKTGTISKNGTVVIVIPTVNANGDIVNELKTITFSLDSDKTPILNNDSMPLVMYNTIVNAISTSPVINKVDMESSTDVPVPPENDILNIAQPKDIRDADTVNTDDFDMDALDKDTSDKPSDENIFDTKDFFDNGSMSKDDIYSKLDTTVPSSQTSDNNDEENKEDENEQNEEVSLGRFIEHPVEFGVAYSDIASDISRDDIKKFLNESNIKYKELLSSKEGVYIYIDNSNQADAFKNFIKTSMNLDDNKFKNAFPELNVFESDVENQFESIQVTESSITLPYNSNFIFAFDKVGIDYTVNESSIIVNIKSVKDKNKVNGIINKAINEGIKITIEDTKTKKKMTLDASDVNIKLSDLEDEKEDGEDSDEDKDEDKDGNISFGDDTQLYDKAPDEKNDDEKKEGENNEGNKSKKKVFKFVPKKMDESVLDERISVNEEAKPNVYDRVMYKDMEGQVIGKLTDGRFIVLAGISTYYCEPNEIKLIRQKQDTVESPFKFDTKTLKPIYEQMISCQVVINGNNMFNESAYCNFNEYKNAKNGEVVNVVVNDFSTPVNKNNIVILENAEEFANPNDYVVGYKKPNSNGIMEGVIINKKDYDKGLYDDDVRCLVEFEGEMKMVMLSKDTIELS